MYQRKKTALRVCLFCRQEFMALQKEVNRGDAIFCSRSCVTRNTNKNNRKDPFVIFSNNFIINENGCWIYKRIGHSGYGRMTIDRKDTRASRFSYSHYKGNIPEGMLVCHKCDVPACVNPEHLFLGTSKQNRQDMLTKGRGNPPRGTSQPNSKLTEKDVLDIKKRLSNGEKIVEISKHYNTCRTNISLIKSERNWSWLKIGPP